MIARDVEEKHLDALHEDDRSDHAQQTHRYWTSRSHPTSLCGISTRCNVHLGTWISQKNFFEDYDFRTKGRTHTSRKQKEMFVPSHPNDHLEYVHVCETPKFSI